MSENNFNNNQNDFNNQNNFSSQNNFNNQSQQFNGQNNFNNQNQQFNGQNNYNNQQFNNQNNYNNQSNFNNQQFNGQNNFNNQNQQFNSQNNFNNSSSGTDYTYCFDPKDIQDNKLISAFSYLGILFFLPLVVAPQSQYGKFHANQSLILFISYIALGIMSRILSFRIFSFLFIIKIILGLLSIVLFVAAIYGIINAATGKAKEIPIIGSFRILK